MVKEFTVKTKERYQLVDITDRVRKVIEGGEAGEGRALIFVPHSTAAVLLTENESGLKKDLISVLKKIVSGFDFLHNRIDDNADSHILSALIGQGRSLIVKNNRLILGTWQQIFLVELDGPRARKVMVQFM